jgi:hypothetical protein
MRKSDRLLNSPRSTIEKTALYFFVSVVYYRNCRLIDGMSPFSPIPEQSRNINDILTRWKSAGHTITFRGIAEQKEILAMRISLIPALLVASVLHYSICSALGFEPVTDFGSWSDFENTGATFSLSDDTVTVTAPGADVSAWNNFGAEVPGAVGILASVNVAVIEGNAQTGLRKEEIGSVIGPEKNRIEASIHFQRWEGSSHIQYSLREMNDDDEEVRLLYRGQFGGDLETITGRDIVIALGRVGDEIWFYAEPYGLVKIQPTEMDREQPTTETVGIFAFRQGGTSNSVTATFGGIYTVVE